MSSPRKKSANKKRKSTVLLILIWIAGLSLLLYPSLSDYWNSFHQSRLIADYAEQVTQITDDTYDKIWSRAEQYNKQLADRPFNLILSQAETKEYEETLDVTGTGIMSYIEIPQINCSLPVYHGTEEGILQIAIGHIPGTALPVGGESTHCVLSGHRGLPSARLFTDLDQLREGDIFMIRTLDEVLTYEVDQILIVLPNEVQPLQIVEGEDYCTLVTCTPYGINTHRLLVRGHRIETVSHQSIRVPADAQQIKPIFVAPFVSIPILLVLLIWLLTATRKKTRRKKKE